VVEIDREKDFGATPPLSWVTITCVIIRLREQCKMSTRADSENRAVQPIIRVFHPYYRPSHQLHTSASENGVPKTTIIAFCSIRSGNHQYQDCSMQ